MLGLVLGKFCPPHKGHSFLIETALAQVDELFVLVCHREDFPIPVERRVGWLQDLHPRAHILVLDQRLFDKDDAQAWVDATVHLLGRVPDLIFSSESYGDHYAQLSGCRHVLVDGKRLAVPIAASQIWQEPQRYAHFLEGPVRDYLLRRYGG